LGLNETVEATPQTSANQRQTDQAFGFKWAKRETYESPASKVNMKRWLLERYCAGDASRLDQWLSGSRKLIVDAGCGAGFSGLLFFGARLRDHDYLGVDISSAVSVARQRFSEAGIPGDFLQCDLSHLPVPDASVDIIFSEGVLHHTDSTERSLKYLARKLAVGGRFLFYVYRKKAVIREFTDDYIRNSIKGLSDEQAWEALKPITSLGIALGKLDVQIEIDEAIPILGIPAGTIDLQRFFYWNICKAFYRPDYQFDEMHHINFDWFRPLNCHRHTPEEIAAWCAEAGLKVERLDVQEAGITVVARKT
jgi:SAM-dependent methyltransferase